MTAQLVKKYATARRILQDQGATGVFQEIYTKAWQRTHQARWQTRQRVERMRAEARQRVERMRAEAKTWPHRTIVWTEATSRRVGKWSDKWLHGLDNYWLGRLIEAQGNVINIEGCAFSLDSPAITTDVKSRFLFDRYEKPERLALKKYLDPKLPVIEFGAAIGVVACLTNKQLVDPKRHVVVEANPDIVPVLEKNRDSNNCQFTILQRAIAHEGEYVTFNQCVNYLGSSAHALTGPPIKVQAATLREIINDFGFERCSLVCDIEGGEVDLVRHEAKTLTQRVQTLIVEVHPHVLEKAKIRSMFSELERAGFQNVYKKDTTYVFQNRLS